MTTEDQKKLNSFVKEYKEIQFNLDLMQKSINSLAEKRDNYISRLDMMKDEEQEFLKHIIEEYGETEVTPNKLAQYIEE
jgi:hypothetical protein